MNLLTPEDLVKLTGAKQAGKQADVLNQHGIFYIRRQDGSLVTTWHHVNHPQRHNAQNDGEPDFGEIA